MKVGVFTPLLSSLPLEDVLQKLAKLNIHTVELGTGNYPGDPHCKLSMLENQAELAEFKKKLDDHGFSISALSSHGNPLHPNVERARHDREVSRKTVHVISGVAGMGVQKLLGELMVLVEKQNQKAAA